MLIRSSATLVLLACWASTAAAQTVSAEPAFRKGTWLIGASLGGAAFTDFQRATARTVGTEFGVLDFQRRVSAGSTVTLGGSLTHWLIDGAGLRVNVSYSPTRFSVHNARDAQRRLDDLGEWDQQPYAKLAVWQASTTAIFRMPVRLGRVVPYGMIGGGLVHYRLTDQTELPPEARRRFDDGTWTAPAAVIGLGAAVPLQRRGLLLNFELTNYITPTPLNDEGSGETFELGGVPLLLDRYAARDSDGIAMTSHLRLTVGVTMPLRR
jgi:opacity protein-like surface antigen